MQMLERALADSDRDVRIGAVRAVAARGHRAALPRIETIVKSREIRNADLTERMAFFEAFGALCGETGIAFLDGILNGKSGLLGRKEDPDVRACAAMALGQVKSPKAQGALQKALSEKDLVVRNAVNRALRRTS
jgi:HEAT repeat protein